MLLTDELQEKLKSLCEEEVKIIIEGFNDLGDTFTSKGKVSKGDHGNPVVYKNVVFIDFGSREGKPYSKWVAPFITEFKPTDQISRSLIIKTIRLENGEVLFENADAKKYLKAAKENMREYKINAQKEGRWIEEPDAVSAELMSMLGSPIRLDGEDGVLVELPRLSTYYGSAMITVKSASMVGGFHVDSNSTLETINEKTGEVEYVVSNKENAPENIAIKKRRVKNIAEAQKKRGSQPGEE